MSKDTFLGKEMKQPKRKTFVKWAKIFFLVIVCLWAVSFYKQFNKTLQERGLDLYEENSAQWEESVRQAKSSSDGLKFVRVYEQYHMPGMFWWVVYDESDEIIDTSKFQYKYWTYDLMREENKHYETTNPLNVAKIKGHYYLVDRDLYQQGYNIVRAGKGYEIQKGVCSSIKSPVEEDCGDFLKRQPAPDRRDGR